jgi:transcriptional regulator with XRE-family HTH domain
LRFSNTVTDRNLDADTALAGTDDYVSSTREIEQHERIFHSRQSVILESSCDAPVPWTKDNILSLFCKGEVVLIGKQAIAMSDILDDTVLMTASEATLRLRQYLGLSRQQFAELLNRGAVKKVSSKMIQRIEDGQGPSGGVLIKLAKISSQHADLQTMTDTFEAARIDKMKARVKDVRETERIRRVGLADLKYWSGYLFQTADQIEHLSGGTEREFLMEYLRNAAFVMHHVRDQLETVIAEPYTNKRRQEEKETFRNTPRNSPKGSELWMKNDSRT